MAKRARTYWTSERVSGAAGRFHVVVSRTAGGGSLRDSFSASLFRTTAEGEELVAPGFWQSSSPPHDADKLAFLSRVRRAATEMEEPPAEAG